MAVAKTTIPDEKDVHCALHTQHCSQDLILQSHQASQPLSLTHSIGDHLGAATQASRQQLADRVSWRKRLPVNLDQQSVERVTDGVESISNRKQG